MVDKSRNKIGGHVDQRVNQIGGETVSQVRFDWTYQITLGLSLD